MATTTQAQQQANITSPTASFYYQPPYAQGQFTPTAGTTPPSNTVSPTNQISHLHTRQLQQPKQPMYVPAALRQTELPARRGARPDTPPRSAHSSMDSGHKFPFIGVSLPNSPVEEDGPGGFAGMSGLYTEELNEEAFGQVSGTPTRNHWKPDSTANTCTSPTCENGFSLFNRRHHCRRCGNIFCGTHSIHEVRLDQHARFHPQGTLQRACDDCYSSYREWKRARSSRQGSDASSSSDGSGITATAVVGVPGAGKATNGSEQKVGSVAQSVPRDWSWSTF